MRYIVAKIAVLFLLLIFLAPQGFCKKEPIISDDLKSALLVHLQTSTLVIFKDDKITKSNDHNLDPLLEYMDANDLKEAYAFDKTVGRAAAYLYVWGGVKYVYAGTISKPAIEIFKTYKIPYEAGNVVEEIRNKSNTDTCPFEKLVMDAINPAQAYGRIYQKMYPKTSIVYFMPTIEPENLVITYQTVDKKLEGNVAVKIHSGEPGGNNFLQPEFIKPIVDELKGTIVECNTAYKGKRFSTQDHLETIKTHGFDKIAKVDIMDATGQIALPVPEGKQIKVNYVGENLKNYNSMLVLSHFKGHQMGGFGGALKNLSIGVASSYGKGYIHGAGIVENMWNCEQDKFLEAMADADKSVTTYMKNNLSYINVMSKMSVDCDCNSHPQEPEIADIGVLGSVDPVALDKACVDLVYKSSDEGKKSLIERIESRHGIHTIEAAEKLGVGKSKYKLIEIRPLLKK